MKAQTTLFLVLGIALAIILALALYSPATLNAPVSVDTMGARTYLEQCLQRLGRFGVFALGYGGGTFHPATTFPVGRVHFTLQDVLPSEEEMRTELSRFMESHAGRCVERLRTALPGEQEIQAGVPKTDVLLGNEVRMDIRLPVRIVQTTSIKDIPELYTIVVQVHVPATRERAQAMLYAKRLSCASGDAAVFRLTNATIAVVNIPNVTFAVRKEVYPFAWRMGVGSG